MEGDPKNPVGLQQGLAAADQQPLGQVGQICETCPNNWVEAGAIDESTGQPLPNLAYRIFEIASKDEVARGVLNENGQSPRHQIPIPATQLFVMFGTNEAIDKALEEMEAMQREQALQENAADSWRGFPAGLSKDEFTQQHRARLESGDFADADRGYLETGGSGFQGLWGLAGSVLSGDSVEEWAETEYARRRDDAWDQYQLITGNRAATAGESFWAGAAQGATFGFDDEIGAGLRSLFDDRSYEELVDVYRHTAEQRQISNPGYYMGGEIAGAVPTIFVPVGGAAGAAARTGARAAVVSGAKTGAALGAVSGAGHDEGGIVDRLDGAALGAATGGIAGAVLSGAGVLIARGMSKTQILARISNKLTARDFPDIADRVSQKQNRHVQGRPEYRGGGHMNSLEEAQTVLDQFHTGSAEVIGRNGQGFPIVRSPTITGTNVNVGAGYPSQPTNIFIIKGTSKPSVVPTNPNR